MFHRNTSHRRRNKLWCILSVFPSSVVLMKDRCKLFCRVTGTMAYYQLKDRVIDGTPCGPDTYDICVQGLCRVTVLPCINTVYQTQLHTYMFSQMCLSISAYRLQCCEMLLMLTFCITVCTHTHTHVFTIFASSKRNL